MFATIFRDNTEKVIIFKRSKENEERYGYPSCPCRMASGEFEKDRDIICPCDYRDPDVMEHGACYCCLYVDDTTHERNEINPIPERRPTEKQYWNDDIVSYRNNNTWIAEHPSEAMIFDAPEKTWQQLSAVYKSTFKDLVFAKLPEENHLIASLNHIRDRLIKVDWDEVSKRLKLQ